MQLTTCCGCCSLKTGTIIIGVLGIVFSVLSLIVILMTNIEWETIIGLDKTTAEIIFAIYYCIIILFCTLLVIGSIKKNAFMMLPWMVLNMIIIVVFLVIIIYRTIVFINYDLVLSGLFTFFFDLVALMINMYMWLVVYHHFQELRIESKNCAQEWVSTVNHIIIDDEGPARPRERSDPTSAISFT
ncbi:lysosomal-associated transmembrane protein 4A-like [Formica exsecta]|uniref:lysosomal-associated transmembrane protein 4A-like n=1 Tax=Formica exsecta TaxID=72781 RepID=UPI00114403BF|nr:lysosomal-associated transmembrane protein 4A-like [Formica exsecta]XP_029671211.1 lysosomal-associated transmembrane protein 4A-like [Formica exsecta]